MRLVLRSVGTVVLAATALGPALATGSPPAAAAADPLVRSVNPFIGTQDNGNTFPGASAPFGMVQVSPDTGERAATTTPRTRSTASARRTCPASAARSSASCR